MRQNNLTADGAYEYFVHRAQVGGFKKRKCTIPSHSPANFQDIAIGYGRSVVGWEEIWNHFGPRVPGESNSTKLNPFPPPHNS